MAGPLLFISYRRDDTQWIARSLHRYLAERLGSHRVFMDTIEVRSGDNWRTRLNEAANSSSVMLVLIGKEWLTLKDRYGRPRIDSDNDWVRQEIRATLNHNKHIIPVYVDGAERIQDPQYLPNDIRRLIDCQDVMLTDDYWDQGLINLISRLERFGFEIHSTEIPMPERRKKVTPLSKIELDDLQKEMPGWSVTTTYASTGSSRPIARTEMYREYRFASFVDATRFMAEVSLEIDEGQHHPRWENIWTTVRVWLSTWDIEFQPSSFDVKLAKLLDGEYNKFVARRPN